MLPSQTEMNSLLVVETEIQNMMFTLKSKGILLDNKTPLLAAAQKFFLVPPKSEEPSDADTSFASWEAVDEENDKEHESEPPSLEYICQPTECLHTDSDIHPVLTKETIETTIFGGRHDAHNAVEEFMNLSTMTALEPEEETQDVLNSSTQTALEPELVQEEEMEQNAFEGWWNAKTMSYYHGMIHHDHQGTCTCQLCTIFGKQKLAWEGLVEEIDLEGRFFSMSSSYHVEKYEEVFLAAKKAKKEYDSIVEDIEERRKINELLSQQSTEENIQAAVDCGHCDTRNRSEVKEPWLCDCYLLCDKAGKLKRDENVKEDIVLEKEDSLLNCSTMTAIEPEETVSTSIQMTEIGAQKIQKFVSKKDNQVSRWREQLQSARNDPSGDYNDLLIKMREEMKSAWF